jgi:heptosyltransferase-1
VNRVLIIRLGALGDVVHAIPVAAALRRAFPSLRIDWLVSEKHREILDLVPVVDRRLVIHDRGESKGRSLSATIRELRQAHYDVALDLQGLLKSALLARSSNAPRVIGFSARYLRERFARLFYTETYNPGGSGMYDTNDRTHVVQTNLGLLRPLGLTVHRLEFPIDPVDSPIARDVAERAAGRFALLNPGATWPNKRWPASRFGTLARALCERHHLTSIVLWGPGEETLARQAAAESNGSAWPAPPTSIADLVALARGATVMVSGDTGPAHIAAAVGTPLVSIHGPTRPDRNGPWAADDVVVTRDTVCKCHHLRRCRADRMCLMDIETDEVAAAVARRLDAQGGRV